MLTWQLNPRVRLRRTLHGGAAFLPDTVTTIELDAEAFATTSWLITPQTARHLRPQLMERFHHNFTVAAIDIFLRDLAAQEILLETTTSIPSSTFCLPSALAPESVHLQLNNVCNLRCPSCYVGLHAEDTRHCRSNGFIRCWMNWRQWASFNWRSAAAKH